MNKLETLAPAVLRIGIAFVFLWFGAQQISNPNVWTSLIPQSLIDFTSISALHFVYLNGIFEVIFASALFLGFYTRTVAFILALHMLDITYIIGFNATGVRDFGLFIATITVFLLGAGKFSLDYFSKKKLNEQE